MTQKELIEFCKENDPNYNKDASFKVLEPMWTIPKGIGGIGITESEFKNGFYVQIDTKGRKGFEDLEGGVFYFEESVISPKYGSHSQLYNSHWKKYFIPLNDLDNWGKEIIKRNPKPILTEEDPFVDLCMAGSRETEGKGILEQIEDPFLKETPKIKEYSKNIENFTEVMEGIGNTCPPIVKESVETMFRLNHTWLKLRKREKPTEKVNFTIFDGEEPFLFEVTKEEFSDLVDLMIEARKDLMK